MKKIITCLYLSTLLCMCIFHLPAVYANDTQNHNDVESYENIDNFSKYVIPVFEKNPYYTVIDISGTNVTKKFVSDNESLWRTQNYNFIKEYLYINKLTVVFDNPINTRSFSKSYAKEFYRRVSGTGTDRFGITREDSGGEICWIVRGSATADNKGIITSYTKPTLSASSGIIGWYPSSVSCYATKDRANLKVSYSFKASWTKTATVWINCTFSSELIKGNFNFTPVS